MNINQNFKIYPFFFENVAACEEEIKRVHNAVKVDPLEILKLPTTFEEQDVKKAYRKLTVFVHPDRVPERLKQSANEAFQKVSAVNINLKRKGEISDFKNFWQFVRQISN